MRIRNLVLVLGDQLNHDSAAWNGFDPACDAVWMAEVASETEHVWCHKLRIAMFLSAMRHFRDELQSSGKSVHYRELPPTAAEDRWQSHGDVLRAQVPRWQPQRLIVVQPGDLRVQTNLELAAADLNVPLEIRADTHFYCDHTDFAEFAENRKRLLLETFYRGLRQRECVLLTDDGEPEGGAWNFDHDNRERIPKGGPPGLVPPPRFVPDPVSQAVITLVAARYADHPGELAQFSLPVCRADALKLLDWFIREQLPNFGRYEDAMWQGEAVLYHSRLSFPLNLKLLSPRECVTAAEAAYRAGTAPLNSVEGFIRQILGWREFVRGVYWLRMPEYAELNALNHQRALPAFYWDGQTDMACVRDAMQNVLQHGYTHHIQRLMVLGNLALLLGVHPLTFHQWHMAMYLDAIDWVSLPNTLGMSQYGDGGVVGTKPYVSTGQYIHKMSNYCGRCVYDYRDKTGDRACPFSTLYWHFLDRHSAAFERNPRMALTMKNLARLKTDHATWQAVQQRAAALITAWCGEAND